MQRTDWNSLSDEAFRAEVRTFFETEFPEHLRFPAHHLRWAEVKDWYGTLFRKGWAAPAWPVEWGGMGLTPAKQLIFIEEQERHGVARTPDMGIVMLGPLLIQYGAMPLRQLFLPPTLRGDFIWCQGYSEPGAGSDLAALRTEAILEGDHYRINGSKIWTSYATDATHMFMLARTEKGAKKQDGISFLLVDMKSPGITVRPIRNIGGSTTFAEVFFDDVRTPADWLVGERDHGWSIAKSLLGFERLSIGSPRLAQAGLKRLDDVLAERGGAISAQYADRVARLRLDVADLASLYEKFAAAVRRGERLGADVSVLKVFATELFQRLSELSIEVAGSAGGITGRTQFREEGSRVDVLALFYNARPPTIYGGSNEIQRNIIAKSLLNLPMG